MTRVIKIYLNGRILNHMPGDTYYLKPDHLFIALEEKEDIRVIYMRQDITDQIRYLLTELPVSYFPRCELDFKQDTLQFNFEMVNKLYQSREIRSIR